MAMIEFDLNGRKLALDQTVVQKLRTKALAGAGSSSTLNDLAVILSRALSEQKPVTLRRAESRALEQLLLPPWTRWTQLTPSRQAAIRNARRSLAYGQAGIERVREVEAHEFASRHSRGVQVSALNSALKRPCSVLGWSSDGQLARPDPLTRGCAALKILTKESASVEDTRHLLQGGPGAGGLVAWPPDRLHVSSGVRRRRA